MADHKKKSSSKPGQQAKRAQEQRYQQAEAASRALMECLTQLEDAGQLAASERASQYANTTRAYFRRLRNGKVLSPADFTAAADVCQSARRALQALDPELAFADLASAEALRAALAAGDAAIAAFQEIKRGGKTA